MFLTKKNRRDIVIKPEPKLVEEKVRIILEAALAEISQMVKGIKFTDGEKEFYYTDSFLSEDNELEIFISSVWRMNLSTGSIEDPKMLELLLVENQLISDEKEQKERKLAMDIYSFINSRDIVVHCREIGKTWNTCL